MRLSSEELPQYYPDNHIRGYNDINNDYRDGEEMFKQEAYLYVGYISEI